MGTFSMAGCPGPAGWAGKAQRGARARWAPAAFVDEVVVLGAQREQVHPVGGAAVAP